MVTAAQPVEPALEDRYTTRCGGNTGGNAKLTEHVIDRATERTLCGRDARIKGYRSSWTRQFDGLRIYLGTDGHFTDGVCQRCAASARKRGFVKDGYSVFQPTKD